MSGANVVNSVVGLSGVKKITHGTTMAVTITKTIALIIIHFVTFPVKVY